VPAAEGLSELRRSGAGAVIAPTDAGYDQARHSFNALVDRRPATIVTCFGPSLCTAFDLARGQGLEVAVRGGGHKPAGHCVLDGGHVCCSSRTSPISGRHPRWAAPGSDRVPARDRTAAARAFVAIYRRAGFAPRLRDESFHTGWDLGVLAEIPAAAVAPQTVASGLPDGTVAVPISEPTDPLETCLVWRNDDSSPALAAFVAAARSALGPSWSVPVTGIATGWSQPETRAV
jgi:hypothetical protein